MKMDGEIISISGGIWRELRVAVIMTCQPGFYDYSVNTQDDRLGGYVLKSRGHAAA
jgi:hypothetical protein